MQLNPYLLFAGNCEQAFKFDERALGAKILSMMTHEQTPMAKQTAPEWQKKIIHGRIKIGDQIVMASDAPPDHHKPMQGFSVTLSVTTPAEAERLFNALAEKATTVTMPIQETFWAQRFGMLVDQFGTPWMINCEKADQARMAS